jgi:PAS domain S-box-containing protein
VTNANPLLLAFIVMAATLLPSLVLVGTSYVKVSIVLGSVRNALGTPRMPGNLVVVGLSVILSLHIMAPTGAAVVRDAGTALTDALAREPGSPESMAALGRAWDAARPHAARFLRANASVRNRGLFLDLARRARERHVREGIAGVCLIVADLTEHKRRERLAADEAMARSILERVADAVVVCDAEGKVLRASRTAHALCGQNPVLKSFQEMFPLTVLRPGVEEATSSALGLDPTWRTETLRGLEVRLARPGGRRFDLLLSAGPLVVAGGDTLGTVVTLTDITALREAQEELRQRAEALQEADRRKDDFLAMLAHELRNPLAPIRAALDVMRLQGVEDPHLRQGRDVIERQTQQLTRLVDDLLEVARINSGKIKLRRAPVEVARVVSTAVEAMRPAMDAKRHALAVSLPDEPLWLDADFARLVQVIGNLLHNAAKYTDEGGRVRVSVAREGNEAVVRVRDSGVGIPPHMLARVFDLFTQVDRSLDRSQGGLGIGLALVRRLVVKHGGQVEARSEGAGKGSEFVLRFPLIAPPAAESARGESARDSGTPPSRRVLIVDDNADSAEMMGALMEVCGHSVRVALSGAAALESAREFRPEVVICDIGLPLMDGYEVARRMRAEPSLAGVRLVALTGYGRPEDLRRSHEAGFDAHLVKPFDLAKLAEVFGEG